MAIQDSIAESINVILMMVAPASFWVDRRGKIVDYDFGYSSDVADRIESKLEQLLESETAPELDKE